jgi:hypothetical protein
MIIAGVEDLFLGSGNNAFRRTKEENMDRNRKLMKQTQSKTSDGGEQAAETTITMQAYSTKEPSEDLKKRIKENVRAAREMLCVGTPGDPSRPGYRSKRNDGVNGFRESIANVQELRDRNLGGNRPLSTSSSIGSQPTIHKWLNETSDGVPGVGFRPKYTNLSEYSSQRSSHPATINFASDRNPFASLINHNLARDRCYLPRELVVRYWCHDKVQDELRDDFRIRSSSATAADVVREYISNLPEEATSEVAVEDFLKKRFVGALEMDQYRSMFAVLFLMRCEENDW